METSGSFIDTTLAGWLLSLLSFPLCCFVPFVSFLPPYSRWEEGRAFHNLLSLLARIRLHKVPVTLAFLLLATSRLKLAFDEHFLCNHTFSILVSPEVCPNLRPRPN